MGSMQFFKTKNIRMEYAFDDGAFGYQLMAGLVKDFSPCVQGFLEYRLTDSSEIENLSWDNGDNVGTFELDPGHHIIAGFRLFF